jgi:hypothetical protein
MIAELQTLIDQYWSWLRDKTALREVNETWVEVTAPYLDRHNDYIQFYIRRDNGGFILTDDAHTIQDLRNSGCDLKSGRRQEMLQTTLRGYGINLEGDALSVTATPETFAQRKHDLVQAILAINDMFYMASPVVNSLFIEDVGNWLRNADVRALPKVRVTGKSGYDYTFDFAIPASRTAPERIVEAINHPTRDLIKRVAFAWIDTREARSPGSRAYALINDREGPPPQDALSALRSYDVQPVLWSRRDDVRDELVA